MVNREVAQFKRACVHAQLINLCSHGAHQMFLIIESYNSFDVVFIDFGEPGDIPDWNGYCDILTCLDCMTGFGLGKANELKEITPDQVV